MAAWMTQQPFFLIAHDTLRMYGVVYHARPRCMRESPSTDSSAAARDATKQYRTTKIRDGLTCFLTHMFPHNRLPILGSAVDSCAAHLVDLGRVC